ncbi:MAG: DUF4124 domain-containing protein [Rudaea sp.]|uniref:DUF4124 domain-containing protein n=1 Tax=Rudaea sp. TaxID=2136325 RepID=UPI0039E7287D
MFDLYRAPRPLRWYEWLILLLLAGYAAGTHGEVYKCIGADGAATFQDRPCAAAAEQTVLAIAPAPAYSPSPAYSAAGRSDAPGARRAARARVAPRRAESAGAGSYECRTADGQVFYRHGACPRSVAAVDQGISTHRGRAAGTAAKSVAVTSTRVSREDACHEMRRAGAASRRGREHDEDVSTYDKNLGRDPCR